MSTLIIGILLVTAMNTAGYATRSQVRNKDLARAKLIANAMLAEILELVYEEPKDTPVFGPETGEVRSSYDDVDDYDTLSDSPPVNKQANAFAGGDGLTLAVTVDWADPDDFATVSLTEKGVKRITVTVWDGKTELTSMTTVVVQ